MLRLDVNTDELVGFTNSLERVRTTAVPKAVRKTLNSAAFDVKGTTLLSVTRKKFVRRRANFFKANSSVSMAKGSNVNNMKSEVGMVDLGGNNYAVDDLVQQERGGIIKGRSFIPLDTARVSKNYKRNVSSKNRIKNIKGQVVSSKRARGSNKSQRFVKSVIHAGVAGVVLDEEGTLWRVQSLDRGRGGKFKLKAIYSYKPRRGVKVKPTYFMQTAGERSGKKMADWYKKNAAIEYMKAIK